ncbi:glycosyltransferase [Nonlabens mediterrranea]|uniref:Glycosyltransferase n=1 Tax=Nonlabens mediterrranea TaxID=1419947 RepID=A0ABS0A2P0_9FLAO|nr:glycosyltransferase [Nonlabens mediterrranea]
MNNKIKILWVIYDFVQAGGQRYAYEIAKKINKDKFQIDFLRMNTVQEKGFDKDFYLQPTLNLGSRVFKYSDFFDYSNRFKEKVRSYLTGNRNDRLHSLIIFLESYDVVHFNGVNVYDALSIRNSLRLKNEVISILTGKFQGIDIYKKYDKNKRYSFVSGFEKRIRECEFDEFENIEHTYFPLSVEIDSFDRLPASYEKQVIAVFTRISAMKPLEPYFFGIKLLKEKGIDVELHIYGAGDPYKSGLIRKLKYLYLEDVVKFRGHVPNLKECLKKEPIDVVWFQSTDGQVAGYSSIEISFSGLPQVLWDFNFLGTQQEETEIFPSYTSINSFVNKTEELLKSEDKREYLGNIQRDFVAEKYSIDKNISILEELYIDIATKN